MTIRRISLSLAVAATLVAAPVSTAHAASSGAAGSVRIGTIPTATAKYKGTAWVKPHVSTSGRAVVDTKTFTITKNGKTVKKNASSASLRAGKYRVTTTVKWRGYRVVEKKSTKRQRYVAYEAYSDVASRCRITGYRASSEIFGANCTPRSKSSGVFTTSGWTETNPENGNVYLHFDSGTTVVVSGAPVGQTVSATAMTDRDLYGYKNVSVTKRGKHYGRTQVKKRTQSLTIKAGKKPRTCATYSDFKKVNADFDDPESYGDGKSTVASKLHNNGSRSTYSESGDTVIEFRDYRTCNKDAILSVGFFNGHAYDKTYWTF